ncbi:MAG TPA: thioredoxin domain-containing protein [Pyrinomonadaceae bacterium]|jgi:protein-disulfide isomerase|nr:thioredoxin domain-containing protein [Pyrinomonadaceae bacterium]
MNYHQALIAFLIGLFMLAATPAQTPRRTPQTPRRTPAAGGTQARPGPATPSATPSATPAAATAKRLSAPPAGALAMVNGQAIMPADVEPDVRAIITGNQDPYMQAYYEDTLKETAAARARALDARTRSLLIEAEAKRRKISVAELIEKEVTSRVPAPSEDDIKAVYDANRAQLGGADLESVRPQIINYIRGKVSERLYSELATRMRMTNTVTRGADPNAQNLPPGAVLVTVGDKQFTAGMLDERLKPYFYKMRLAVYDAQKTAVNKRINDILLMAEAQRRGVTQEQIIDEEVNKKIHHPTDADVEKFYQENKERINSDLASVRAEIVKYLEQQEEEKTALALAQKLRAGADVRLLIKEPEAPVQAISLDDDPSRGDARSPVTIVEFTDFQCPACGAMYPVLEETLKSYGARVHFVVRDFPLAMHPFARKAAEAAAAANAQGKFFEYINLLFTHQNALDVDSLKNYATQLNLDRARFDAALDAGTYAAEVQHDVEDGELYGVDSTPAIFINGVRLQDLTAEGIRAAINKAFARAGAASK